MNAGQLNAGEYYAYRHEPPKGRIPLDAIKVRLRHTEQRKRSDMQNRQTVAAVTVVETGKEMTVPARHIIDFWDDYEAERDVILEERKKIEMDRRRREMRDSVLGSMITYRLHERQVPLTPTTWYNSVSFPISQIQNWLEISEEQIEMAIDKAMENEFGEAYTRHRHETSQAT